MKYVAVYVAAFIVVLFSVVAYVNRPTQSVVANEGRAERTIQLKDDVVRVSVVSTSATREQGLSGRAGLDPDEGMLFVFEQEGEYAFWMKDMRFSINILWIDSSGKIIYIAPSVSPDTYPRAFDPHLKARYVLELPAGYVTVHDVQVGDTVQI